MRKDAIIWLPERPALQKIEKVLAESCGCSWQRRSSVITPLFHASPKYRLAEALPDRLRLFTLENGDYQQINNPLDPNFDEIFIEWPRIITYFDFLGTSDTPNEERQAILECHDLETNWEKAGWTSGTTWTPSEDGLDRHKIILGYPPWGWTDYEALAAALERSSKALATQFSGTWHMSDIVGGSEKELKSFFKNRPQ